MNAREHAQHRARTLWLTGVLHAFTHLYQAVLLPLYLLIQKDFQLASVGRVTLLVTVMLAACFGPSYPAGILADRLNRKKLLAFGLALNGTAFAALGLARGEAMPETEDHVAYLCEVMRYLIAGDDVAVCNLTAQRNFFATHLQPWILQLCDALQGQPAAHFYAALAQFTRAFVAVEAQGFDMLD